jgi:hypothetical protein
MGKKNVVSVPKLIPSNYWEYVIYLSIGVYPDTFDFDLTNNTQWIGLVDKYWTLTYTLEDTGTDGNVVINSLVNQQPTLNITVNWQWEWWALLKATDTHWIIYTIKLYIRET